MNKNPWAALERRLISISTQVQRAVRHIPPEHEGLVVRMQLVLDNLGGTIDAVENLRINWANNQALDRLEAFNRTAQKHLKGG